MARVRKAQIRKFNILDQDNVKKLILNGLTERWGFLDETKNPDLDNIKVNYANGVFLVALMNSKIVGCGALVPINKKCAEIRRMSVAENFRNQGIGKQILNSLISKAQKLGYVKITLETTADWSDAVSFYLHNGFQIAYYQEHDVYLSREI